MSTLSLEVPNSLHRRLQELAEQEGLTVDQLVNSAVAEKISALTSTEYLEQRARRGSRETLRSILAKVQDAPPEPGDELAWNVDTIVHVLGKYHQRATYTAVAKLVGKSPQSLMLDRPHCPRDSWIVSKTTGQPSEYSEEDKHPLLTSRSRILETPEELDEWLRSPE